MTEPLDPPGDHEGLTAPHAAVPAGPTPGTGDDDLVPEDDRVIGRALRWSGLALLAIALVVGAVVWVRTTRLFLREDARLLKAIGVPVVIQRPAMFVYGALSS